MMSNVNFYEAKLMYEIDSADVYEALQSGKNWVVIDARKSEAYHEEHIPGAVNMPHREMNEHTTAGMDKDSLYIVYCDGIGCNASTKGALKLAAMGYSVKELQGGLDWWKRDGYATQGMKHSEGMEIVCAC